MDFYERLGRAWDKLWYTSPRRTAQEVDAIVDVLAHTGGGGRFEPPARILDIGCATGRHAVLLARRGFFVVGVDRAAAMVAAARAKARRRGREVMRRARFVRADATRLPMRDGAFDVALSLCEGAFGSDDRPGAGDAILREAARALAPGGRLVLVALERGWLDRHGDWRYDPRSGRSRGRETHRLASGQRVEVEVSTRALPLEVALTAVRGAGLQPIGRAGAAPGEYAAIPLDREAAQYMIIARKEEETHEPG